MLKYIEGNIDFVADFVAQNMPKVKFVRPQASYLMWLDFSSLGLSHDELVDVIVNKANLAMNDGAMFGREGEQCMRMNVGTRREVLAQAMRQLCDALAEV